MQPSATLFRLDAACSGAITHCRSAYDEDVSRVAALLAYHGRKKR